MTDAVEALRLAREESIRAAREDFLEFVLECKDEFIVNFHHEIICERLTRLASQKGQRVIITVPPQYGKSELISRLFPAWVLGRNPKAKIILASYSSVLANGFNRDAQDYIDSDAYRRVFPNTKIPPDCRGIRRESEVQTSGKGYLYTVGIGGSTTGKSANPLLIIDDPIKDMAEALNDETRAKMQEWFNAVALTRCSMDSNIIVMHTRWHDDDLAGYLIDKGEKDSEATQWEVINFPAIADPDDADLRMHPRDPRKKGEALWPDVKGDEAFLKKLKRDLGSVIFNALFQGKPNLDSGNMINPNDFRTYNTMPEKFDKMIISVDCSFRETKTSDFVSIQTWGRIGIDKYLVDQFLERMSFQKTIDRMIDMIEAYPDASAKLVEAKANGDAVIDSIKGEVYGVIAIEPTDSKLVRATAITPQIEAGNVWLPAEAIARFDVAGFKRTCAKFPKVKNDDEVDAMTQALEYLSKGENHYLRKLLGRESRDERGRKYPSGGIRQKPGEEKNQS